MGWLGISRPLVSALQLVKQWLRWLRQQCAELLSYLPKLYMLDINLYLVLNTEDKDKF